MGLAPAIDVKEPLYDRERENQNTTLRAAFSLAANPRLDF